MEYVEIESIQTPRLALHKLHMDDVQMWLGGSETVAHCMLWEPHSAIS